MQALRQTVGKQHAPGAEGGEGALGGGGAAAAWPGLLDDGEALRFTDFNLTPALIMASMSPRELPLLGGLA